MKCPFAYLLTVISLSLACGAQAFGIDVTGLWTGTSQVGLSQYPNTLFFYQQGTDLAGSQLSGSATCILFGSVIGNQISFHTECPTLSYSSDASGTTDGSSMSGTFLDSQSTSGTFTAHKLQLPLTRSTVIATPPIVTVVGDDATIMMQKFKSVKTAALRWISSHATSLKATVQYELTITGSADRRKIISKSNKVTARNLKPGVYIASYRVIALKNGRKLFTTRKSPLATFTIS